MTLKMFGDYFKVMIALENGIRIENNFYNLDSVTESRLFGLENGANYERRIIALSEGSEKKILNIEGGYDDDSFGK